VSPMWARFAALITFIAAVGLFLTLVSLRGTSRSFAQLPLGEKQYEVVLAQSSEEITLGLSYRKNIGADGMLFLFPERRIPTFWMFEMRFPLDFIWIDENTVVSLNQNVPSPGLNAPRASIAQVRPTQPVTAVLEVPAGFIERESIKIGTQVGQVTEIRSKVW
jgi:uncharacterized membrane protein (UPF0127 family)